MKLAVALAAALTLSAQNVRVETSAGTFWIEVHRDWAPHGADRFLELVRAKYYDNSRFYRAAAGKWVQFGIAGQPKVARKWRVKTIPDDPVTQSNKAGYVAFAFTGPGTRSTQIYINLADNINQDAQGFAPFGRVVEGMDVVLKLYTGYGETSGGGMRAGHQAKLFEQGNAYLDREFPRLDQLIRARVLNRSSLRGARD
jgi:cyclophilin family peptidyl-prolyl cis-trans isomerase